MIFERLFRKSSTRAIGQALYEAAIAQARQPILYAELGAPDTVEGRFELYTLHVVMVLHRLKGIGGEAGDASQALFDVYILALDDALREMGVGDLVVGKKMRRLGEAFYGRARHYEAALGAGAAEGDLSALLWRTVYAEKEGARGDPLADYVRRSVAMLSAIPTEDVIAARLTWPEIVA